MQNDTPISDSVQKPARIFYLDILRGIAMLMIIGRHSLLPPQESPLYYPMFYWKQGGWMGVDLFFVISGYLVATQMFSEYRQTGKFNLARFYWRRAFRIFPAYFLFLIVILALWIIRDNSGAGAYRLISEAGPNFYFINNYIPYNALRHSWDIVTGHTWFIAVIIHFYITAPLLFWIITKRPKTKSTDIIKHLPNIIFSICIMVLALRFWNFYRCKYSYTTHFFPTHLRIDSLLFGVLIAHYTFYERDRIRHLFSGIRIKIALLFTSILAILPGFLIQLEESWFISTIGFTLLYLGFGGMAFLAVTAANPKLPLTKSLKAIPTRFLLFSSTYSYTIYLWHVWALHEIHPMVSRLERSSSTEFYITFAAYVIAAFALGIISAHLIERPALKMRNRLS